MRIRTADYHAETAVERELVLRLASLLWRLRRATSIESGLFQIQDNMPKPVEAQLPRSKQDCEVITIFQPHQVAVPDPTNREEGRGSEPSPILSRPDGLDVARCFLRVADLDNGLFERLGRYEASLWRQVRQTITLEGLRWRASGARHCGHKIVGSEPFGRRSVMIDRIRAKAGWV